MEQRALPQLIADHHPSSIAGPAGVAEAAEALQNRCRLELAPGTGGVVKVKGGHSAGAAGGVNDRQLERRVRLELRFRWPTPGARSVVPWS